MSIHARLGSRGKQLSRRPDKIPDWPQRGNLFQGATILFQQHAFLQEQQSRQKQ
jgi:hypothetical protein